MKEEVVMFKSIKLEISTFIESTEVKIWEKDGKLHFSKDQIGHGMEHIEDEVSSISVEDFSKKLEALDISGWKKSYQPVGVVVMDGSSWTIKYETDSEKPVKRSGENAYPRNWKSFIKLVQSIVGDFETFED